MSTRNLDKMMAPRSVVAIGASVRPGSVGAAVTRNLLAGGFKGEVHLLNIKGGTIEGRPVLKSLAELSQPADLAIIMTPAETVPRLILELGERGTKVAVVITAGPGSGATAREDNARWRKRILRAARPHLLRVVGPNCIGYAVPRVGLNASFGPGGLKPGRIAAVAQSGAVLAGLADWGAAQGIGFSHLISMGDMSDVDFGDVLDMLSRDYETRAVLMYVEGITQARKFMSAARGVARLKPVIVLKAGRHAAAAQAAASHTGSMAGSAAVYDAAFARAGLVRVAGLGELFDAAETLGHSITPRNERLAILTNGGGVGIIATDLLMDEGGELAAAAAAHDRAARQADAALLVARQSGRHRGRRRRRALQRGGRCAGRRSWRRRGAGDERADGAHLARRGGACRRRRARRQGGAADLLLDRRPGRAGRPQGPARGRHPGLRHAAARRARLHAHGAVSPRPARAPAHAALGARGPLGHAPGPRHRARGAGREARDPDRAGSQAGAGGLRHSRRADRGRARRRRGGGSGDADRLSRRGESPVARDHPQERRRRRRARPRLGAGGRRRRAQHDRQGLHRGARRAASTASWSSR